MTGFQLFEFHGLGFRGLEFRKGLRSWVGRIRGFIGFVILFGVIKRPNGNNNLSTFSLFWICFASTRKLQNDNRDLDPKNILAPPLARPA